MPYSGQLDDAMAESQKQLPVVSSFTDLEIFTDPALSYWFLYGRAAVQPLPKELLLHYPPLWELQVQEGETPSL